MGHCPPHSSLLLGLTKPSIEFVLNLCFVLFCLIRDARLLFMILGVCV